INPYGASKLAGERAVRVALPDAVIVRTAWIFGGPRSFPTRILAAARRMADAGQPLRVVSDEVGNPTPAADLAVHTVTLIGLPSAPLVLHVAGEPPISRLEWARRVLDGAGLPEPTAIHASAYARDSTPPSHAVLDTSLARSLGLGIDWRAA
ncbi:MAG TPA: sugar nucleotide-binding protein, partial [Candidatus Limnocylindria bacterium]|nr:sugar nucleotide-binding protein [Candidatus Limnocylindria bacterium]